MAHDVLISYSHQDAAFAERLHSKLENFRLKDHAGPKWPLRPMFLDRSELASSPDLSEVIDKALRQSDALIVVCSPAAAVSKWVMPASRAASNIARLCAASALPPNCIVPNVRRETEAPLRVVSCVIAAHLHGFCVMKRGTLGALAFG